MNTSVHGRVAVFALKVSATYLIMKNWQCEPVNVAININLYTVITLFIGTDMPEKTLFTQIRCRITRRLIRVYIICHSFNTISDKSTGSKIYKHHENIPI